jgi:hypothetical protein
MQQNQLSKYSFVLKSHKLSSNKPLINTTLLGTEGCPFKLNALYQNLFSIFQEDLQSYQTI